MHREYPSENMHSPSPLARRTLRAASVPSNVPTNLGTRTLVVRANGDDEAVIPEREVRGTGVTRTDTLAACLRRRVRHCRRHPIRRGGGREGGGLIKGERRGRRHLRMGCQLQHR